MKYAALILGLVAFGCGKPGGGSLPQPSGPVEGAAYYPFAEGSTWTYRAVQTMGGSSPDTLTRQYVAASEEAVDEGPGFALEEAGRGILNSIVMHYGIREGAVVTWAGMAGASKTPFDPPFVELPATIEPAAVWTWNGSSRGNPMSIESRLEGVEKVAVPAGIWDCLRIARSLPNGGRVTHWYAKDIGLVKMDIQRPPIPGLAPASAETWELQSR